MHSRPIFSRDAPNPEMRIAPLVRQQPPLYAKWVYRHLRYKHPNLGEICIMPFLMRRIYSILGKYL